MDAPPAHEDSRPFVHLAGELRRLGLRTPTVFAIDLAHGFLLLEDFGSLTVFDALETHADSVPAALLDAIGALAALQRAGVPSSVRLPPYDSAAVHRELALFPEWFLDRHLGRSGAQKHAAWGVAGRFLIERWTAMPAGVVHRDFHTRNLMLRPAKSLGVIDFQDACYGPLAYDVVSLVKDCYVVWDSALVDSLLSAYCRAADLPAGYSADQFRDDVVLCGIQRHLKVAGIFARLYHRDGKIRYLDDLPRVVAYLRAALPMFAALAPLVDWLPDDATLHEARRCALSS